MNRRREIPGVLLTIGETMALVVPDDRRPLDDALSLRLETAGAESNVACAAADLGVRARWLSRVGDDALGRRVLRIVSGHGVDVSMVAVERNRPTGVMFKNPTPQGTEVLYYRRGSAASGLSVADLARIGPVPESAILHLTGVTPALSASCADLANAVVVERVLGPGVTTSFDVNHRPQLWGDADAARDLGRLAAASDITFVGLDEAAALWSTPTPADIRDHLGDAGTLVVKDAGRGATVFSADGTVFVPAISVEVREAVGAGDAFAGGYLAATLDGADVRRAARVGHLAAARVLATESDLAEQPSLDDLVGPASGSDAAWLGISAAGAS